MMERHGICVGLRPEHRAEYLELHTSVWPEVEETLRAANIVNFIIFLHDDMLFGYYEYVGTDHAADQARVAADPVTQRWWARTDACQRRLPGTPDGAQWAQMRQVWHLGQ